MNLFRAFSCFLSVGKVKVLEIHLLILSLKKKRKKKNINYENMVVTRFCQIWCYLNPRFDIPKSRE